MVFGSGFGAFFSRSLSSPTRSCCCSGPGDRPIRSKIHCAPLLFFRIRLFHLAPCSLDGSFPHPTCLGLIFLPMSFSRCPNSSLFSCYVRRSLRASSSCAGGPAFAGNQPLRIFSSVSESSSQSPLRLQSKPCCSTACVILSLFCRWSRLPRPWSPIRHAPGWRAFHTGGRFV